MEVMGTPSPTQGTTLSMVPAGDREGQGVMLMSQDPLSDQTTTD